MKVRLVTLDEMRKAHSAEGYMPEAYPIGGYEEIQGLRIAIENPKGSKRRWYDAKAGKPGETRMHHPYGYIVGYEGADGDEVDVFLGPKRDSQTVYVINQRRAQDTRKFDEHKVMLGFDSEEAAKRAYLRNYDRKGPTLLGSCRVVSMERFKRWLESGNKRKPLCKSLLMVPL